MGIKVNGKDASKEEVQEILNDDTKKITAFSTTLENPNKNTALPHSNEGFEIKKDLIASMSGSMDQAGAADISIKLEGSPLIKGRTLYLIMAEPDSEIVQILKTYSESK